VNEQNLYEREAGMTALEQEIVDKFEQLDSDAQQRLLSNLQVSAMRKLTQEQSDAPPMPLDEWLLWADTFREKMDRKYGERTLATSSELLAEIREKRLDDLLRSR
jgi:hypothetical protein